MMHPSRIADYDSGMRELPPELRGYGVKGGRNGETLTFDEAEVWKRVLDYRIAKHMQPKVIIETHTGSGCGTLAFRLAAPRAQIIPCTDFATGLQSVPDKCAALIDVDPFGHPYKAIEAVLPKIKRPAVMMVTNGEMMQVVRGLRHSQYLKTGYRGRDAVLWVEEHFIPEIERMTGMTARFHYCFPTTVRLVVSHKPLPEKLFAGCPRLMHWFKTRESPSFF